MNKIGRPPVPPEQRKAGKNIKIDEHVLEMLHLISDKMVDTLGFKPTISQTIRYLIQKAGPTP